jgi:hypothetical protein
MEEKLNSACTLDSFPTATGTTSRWETPNSNPLGPIKLSRESEIGRSE